MFFRPADRICCCLAGPRWHTGCGPHRSPVIWSTRRCSGPRSGQPLCPRVPSMHVTNPSRCWRVAGPACQFVKRAIRASANLPPPSTSSLPIQPDPSPPRLQAVATETKKLDRKAVPLELEDGELPLNTFSPKKPFKACTNESGAHKSGNHSRAMAVLSLAAIDKPLLLPHDVRCRL